MLDCLTEIPLPGRILAPRSATSHGSTTREPLPAFIAGPENKLVAGAVNTVLQAACRSAPSSCSKKDGLVPTPAASPLVLFGESGVGKTHLASGLVRHWQVQLGEESAAYTTAADFRHLLNDAIKRQAEVAFRAHFRSSRLLAIDDLQQLPADDFAWQELRYTLDDYEERGATVIVTANDSPARLANVPADIRSRLAAGLTLQLAPPGDAARVRIIRHAAQAMGQTISDDAVSHLAKGIEGTANTLFGALFELCTAAKNGPATDLKQAEKLLSVRAERGPSLMEILAVVARHQNLPQSQLKSDSRRQSIVFARGLMIFLARELTDTSYEEIGRVLGGRDHTTIIHSYHKIAASRRSDPQINQTIEYLRRILLSH